MQSSFVQLAGACFGARFAMEVVVKLDIMQ